MKSLFCASIMCMDFLNATEEIRIINAGCDMLHADIMDGHFCKNITLSPTIIKSVRPAVKLPIDAHLMVTKPNDYIESLAGAGADYISVHAETINVDAFRTINRIKALGCKVGIVLNPATPLDWIKYYADEIDMLTIMTVDVGYAGQPFIPGMLSKISEARDYREAKGLKYIIQIDGACGPDTYAVLDRAGADAYVMGSSGLFRREMSLSESCELMRKEFTEITGKNVLIARSEII